ncbi:MAG TPA: hypothetical protein DCR04_06925 [Flavobacteriales bacterium]|nr:hypothetical protein [Flavobacteriales bacterium]
MLLIEIILTVIAYRKGWKKISLIPLGAAFSIGSLFGLARQSPYTHDYLDLIWIDLIAIAVLIFLCAKKKPSKLAAE